MKKHIFTIMAGCAPVGSIMLSSFLKHHPNERINVYLFSDDIPLDAGKEINLSISSFSSFGNISVHLLPESLKEDFARGHEGTAKVWARVIKANPDSYLIHIDSDVVFKKESISLIEKASYPDIYGSRRCYENNPANIPVKKGTEDAVSTYFIGFKPSFLGSLLTDNVLANNFERMIAGGYNPLSFPVFDFFDPCFFYMRSQGASVFYEDENIIGGQNKEGSKKNNYLSNMHLDMGSHIAHFGGVGSGYQASKDDSKMNKSYSGWAKYRWNLFENLFYNKEGVFYGGETKIENGRWVAGPPTLAIITQIKNDLGL